MNIRVSYNFTEHSAAVGSSNFFSLIRQRRMHWVPSKLRAAPVAVQVLAFFNPVRYLMLST